MELPLHSRSFEHWAILQKPKGSPMRSMNVGGESWTCPCGNILALDLFERQMLNLLILCDSCGGIVATPSRKPGQPVAHRSIYFPSGTSYEMPEDLDGDGQHPVQMVGASAIEGHARETGTFVENVYEPGISPVITTTDEDSLDMIADELGDLLGERLEKLQKADALGQNSDTPPKKRNRIIELIEHMRDVASSTRARASTGTWVLRPDLLAEGIAVLSAARRWEKHPAWAGLRDSFSSDAEAGHTLILLAVASYLSDAGNRIGLHVSGKVQGEPQADLWIEPDLTQRVDLEVKTPMSLRQRRNPISNEGAKAVLESQVKKSSRQRRATHTSILTVGGFQLASSFQTLVENAEILLEQNSHKWQGLAGICIVDCTYSLTETAADPEELGMQSIVRIKLLAHPGYEGEINFHRTAGKSPIRVEEGRTAQAR